MKEQAPTDPECARCPAGASRLRPLGDRRVNFDYLVALAGNPNTGKSSIFNALTGLRQHVGNWPGKTVTRAEGGFSYGGASFKLVDLPGTYSLLSASEDEEIARNFILFGRPDCTVVVMDATVLERNLNLALQIIEITDKVVLCVNLMDEAARKGLEVDVRTLSRELGVPAVATVARTKAGLGELVATIAGVCRGEIASRPRRPAVDSRLEEAVAQLVPMIEAVAPGLPNARWVAFRLLDGDHRLRQALLTGELGRFVSEQAAPVERASRLIAIEGAQ